MKKTTSERLQEEMLKYYQKQNERLKLTELQEQITQETLQAKQKEYKQMGKKLKKIKDKELIDTIYSIVIKVWEDTEDIGSRNYDILEVLEVQDWFLSKGISISELGLIDILTFDTRTTDSYNYFDEYGMREKIRWNRLLIKIRQKLDNWIQDKERKEFNDRVKMFVDRAREDNLFSVTSSHIKQYASELGLDISGQLNLLTNAVTTFLNKEFGGNKPKKERTLTKSIKIEVFKRDDYTCKECGAGREAKLHVHHIIPVSQGGTDEMSNLVTLCESCNLAVGNRIYKIGSKKE